MKDTRQHGTCSEVSPRHWFQRASVALYLGLSVVQPLARRWVAIRRGVGFSADVKPVRRHSTSSSSRRLKENQEMLEVAFPPTFEIAVYLQPPFNGPADTTCSWGVVSSHQGDVRQCPVHSEPIRPPERILSANATLAGNLTGPTLSTIYLNETVNHTSTGLSY